jgi:vacuolar-type H+-ATPase subunit D/Vma8
MYVAEDLYKVDMHVVVDAVMESNWSKFPIASEVKDIDAMCEWIEEVRKRENVGYSFAEVAGVQRVTFRDNFGEGKIMKPSTFVEPNIAALLK